MFPRWVLIFGRIPRTWKILSRRAAQHRFANAELVSTESRRSSPETELGSPRPNLGAFNPLLFWKPPTFTAAALFLLILSGPPRLRIRDPEASLRGEVDWVVTLHALVWGLAGLWVLCQMGKRFQSERPLLEVRLPQILGLSMILLLGLSTFVSDAPALTAFKVYQMLVSLLFTQIFAERFGIWTSLKTMLWGNVLLCLAIAVCSVLMPDEVWLPTEFNPDPSRLFGDLIAPTGVVSVLAIILLLTTTRRIGKTLPLSLVACCATLLVLSLMRTAYIILLVFFGLVVLRRPNTKALRYFAYSLCLILVLMYAGGSLPNINHYRDPATASNLGDRVGLWEYLTRVTLNQSPWLGLGYYSASRVYGPEYNPGLGTAHSMFIEVLAGGGVPSFALFVALCMILASSAVRLLLARRDRLSFALSTLFLACLLFGVMGDPLHSGPVAMGFWVTAASLSLLRSSMKQPQRVVLEAVDATA